MAYGRCLAQNLWPGGPWEFLIVSPYLKRRSGGAGICHLHILIHKTVVTAEEKCARGLPAL
jgi:hypothetical protein